VTRVSLKSCGPAALLLGKAGDRQRFLDRQKGVFAWPQRIHSLLEHRLFEGSLNARMEAYTLPIDGCEMDSRLVLAIFAARKTFGCPYHICRFEEIVKRNESP